MKITLDSAEPLEDAIRVIGAMYDVELVVSPRGDATKRIERGAGAALSASDTAPTRRRPRKNNGPSAASRAADVPSGGARANNAQIRSWARDNGLTVSDRGRLAASVMAAYRSANNK